MPCPPYPFVFMDCPELRSGISLIIASVVSISDAMEAAFCRAVRVTLVGSITPAAIRSSYCRSLRYSRSAGRRFGGPSPQQRRLRDRN